MLTGLWPTRMHPRDTTGLWPIRAWYFTLRTARLLLVPEFLFHDQEWAFRICLEVLKFTNQGFTVRHVDKISIHQDSLCGSCLARWSVNKAFWRLTGVLVMNNCKECKVLGRLSYARPLVRNESSRLSSEESLFGDVRSSVGTYWWFS